MKLLCNHPLHSIQSETSHLYITVASDGIDHWLVINGEVDHVECWVPACRNIPGHHSSMEAEFLHCQIPFKEDDGSRVFNWKCNLAQLHLIWVNKFKLSLKRLAFASTNLTGWTLSSSDIPLHPSCSPSSLSSSSSSSLLSLPLWSSTLSSRSSAKAANSFATSLSKSLSLPFGGSNWWSTLFATRLMMCRKHQVWFDMPGKASRSNLSLSIMVSLLEVLSHVMLRIYNGIQHRYEFP